MHGGNDDKDADYDGADDYDDYAGGLMNILGFNESDDGIVVIWGT